MPLGIITDPLVPTLPDAALDYDGIVDMIGSLATRNALNGSLAFIGDATVMTTSMKLKDAMERPYGELLWHGNPQFWTNLASFPAAPTNPLVFGNWGDLLIAAWSILDVLVNPFETTAYSKGNILIRAAMTIDIAKRHPESFVWRSTTAAAPEPPGETAAARRAPRA
jgi:hypothetical protein